MRRQNIDAALSRRADRGAEEGRASAGRSATRSKPVRVTIDLDVDQYRLLKRWAVDMAIELDWPRLTHSDIVRSMVGLLSDPEIAARVRATLEANADLRTSVNADGRSTGR